MTTGLRRPKFEAKYYRRANDADFVTEQLPIPWIAEDALKDGKLTDNGWTGFDSARAREGHEQRLCQVCGIFIELGQLVHLNTAHDLNSDALQTSGCGMHPRCALLTLRFCPHFRVPERTKCDDPESAIIAWLWSGDGQGYDPGVDASDSQYWDAVMGDYLPARKGSTKLTLEQLKQLSRTVQSSLTGIQSD